MISRANTTINKVVKSKQNNMDDLTFMLFVYETIITII